jgi:hypothetical protein
MARRQPRRPLKKSAAPEGRPVCSGISARFVVEPGRIDVYAGDSSNATLTRSLTVTG